MVDPHILLSFLSVLGRLLVGARLQIFLNFLQRGFPCILMRGYGRFYELCWMLQRAKSPLGVLAQYETSR